MNPISPFSSNDHNLDSRSTQIIADLYRNELNKKVTLPTDHPLDPKRYERVGFTWDELWSQPEKIKETLEAERKAIKDAAHHFAKLKIKRIVMIGCGDSIASMVAVRSLFESLLGIPCEPIQALEFAYYYSFPVDEQTLVIPSSSSGATPIVVESLLIAKSRGASTLALSNTSGSTLMQEADHKILIHAERKGWPTQSSTAAMAVLYQFALEMARHCDNINQSEVSDLERTLEKTPELIAAALDAHNQSILEVAEKEARQNVYLYTASGPCYASAMFGAAKLKELTPDHAVAIPLEEYHHYRSQKADQPLFLIAPSGRGIRRAMDTAREGKRVGGNVYSVVSQGNNSLHDVSDVLFALPEIDERLSPMIFTIPVQLFAYHLAIAKFRIAENAQKKK
jgi:glutamine---fructose-6-phosphate transaminase (isomerizing)